MADLSCNALSSPMACEFDTHFKVFHELMSNKVMEILLVANAYDAYILEEDGSLASKIINEYRGLNLSRPPRLTRVDNAGNALVALGQGQYDLVIVMPHWDDMDPFELGLSVKRLKPDLAVIILAHTVEGLHPLPADKDCSGVDQIFIWTGDADLLLAIVKSVEDSRNAPDDTDRAQVRVLLLVEDSPLYRSYFLPLIYKEVVHQTQAVLEESLNESHRLLKMRARPKILVAETYEAAIALYQRFQPYLFGVITDTRFPRNGRPCDDAGIHLLKEIRARIPDLPMLLISSETANRSRAQELPVDFLDKNSPELFNDLHHFFLDHLGFGDFVFRRPDGSEVVRVSNLRQLEAVLPQVPDEPLCYHASRNRFSNWFMARSEIALASQLRKVKVTDFPDVDAMRSYLINAIHGLRQWRQKGVVIQFNAETFDLQIADFAKTGQGSLGGKARGLAFAANLLRQSPDLFRRFPNINIRVPTTLVIATDAFDLFVKQNRLDQLALEQMDDAQIEAAFVAAEMPDALETDLAAFIQSARFPLAVRSSSLLEDARHQNMPGLYKTYMLPNNHSDTTVRLQRLIHAVKRVYASAWFSLARRMTQGTAYAHRREQMAVMIQRIEGRTYGDYYYPAVSGVARSRNYYPFGPVTPDDGMAVIMLGFGRAAQAIQDGLRFCPRYPDLLPSFSSVRDILDNGQKQFYALDLKAANSSTDTSLEEFLTLRNLADALSETPVSRLVSTYVADEDRIRDSARFAGPKVLTFAPILKHNTFPLANILAELLSLGRREMGCHVEIEFALALDENQESACFSVLQVRPMSSDVDPFAVALTDSERQSALVYSRQALGHGRIERISDIVYARPDRFDPSQTVTMAAEVGQINSRLKGEGRPYLLVAPGRWGSFDRWLGIPVKWNDIDGVGVMVELRNDTLSADPSFGSHFFHQITAHGVAYLTVVEGGPDRVAWNHLNNLSLVRETRFFRHVRTAQPLLIKCDGRSSECAVLTS